MKKSLWYTFVSFVWLPVYAGLTLFFGQQLIDFYISAFDLSIISFMVTATCMSILIMYLVPKSIKRINYDLTIKKEPNEEVILQERLRDAKFDVHELDVKVGEVLVWEVSLKEDEKNDPVNWGEVVFHIHDTSVGHFEDGKSNDASTVTKSIVKGRTIVKIKFKREGTTSVQTTYNYEIGKLGKQVTYYRLIKITSAPKSKDPLNKIAR